MTSRTTKIMCFIGLGLWIALAGCDRNIEPYQPGEEPREPDLARIFPAPDEVEMAAGAMASPPAAGLPTAQPDATAGRPGAAVRGTVHLAESAAGRSGVLFIIARRQGAVGGPPLAVVRITEPSFPQDFEIGPDNVMVPSMKFEGALTLTARLDSDGNAMTRDPADPNASAPDAVVPGTLGVELQLQ
jgi:hypothetical protein